VLPWSYDAAVAPPQISNIVISPTERRRWRRAG